MPLPDDDQRRRIDELTQLIDRMGPVNLDAKTEHEEAEKRFHELNDQKVDIEKALDELESAIRHMNKESRRRFRETFDAVNALFKKTFPRLFRGGRAELLLTDPEDLAGERRRDHRAAARQEARQHRAHERRREGAHRGLADLRDLPAPPLAVLHPRRGRRPARRGERQLATTK